MDKIQGPEGYLQITLARCFRPLQVDLHSGCHEEDGGIACDVIRGLYGQNVSGDGHRKQHHDERASPFEPVSEECHDHYSNAS